MAIISYPSFLILFFCLLQTNLALFSGHCTRCNVRHSIPTTEDAIQAALDLRRRMTSTGRIDIDELSPNYQDDDYDLLNPFLSTDQLYQRRGKMFGVLLCHSANDTSTIIVLKAYAGKLGGQWNLPGWAPIIGRTPESLPIYCRLRDEVTELFQQIENDVTEEEVRAALIKKRASLAKLALEEVQNHYLLTNFRGETRRISDVFVGKLPGGVGDCAAPKLVAEATRRGLIPVGIAEIFVGATGGMSMSRGDGELYDACGARCEKIAGFMLCGIDDVAARLESRDGGEM
jgi:hypothetical protein